MSKSRRFVKNLVFSGVFVALGLLLPFLTGQIPEVGNQLLPMHLPVLLCGFVCGSPWGLLVGAVLPVFRNLLFGMPPLFPTALAMTFELAAYGSVAGYLYRFMSIKKIPRIYVSLLLAMVAGRGVWGLVSWVLFRIMGTPFTWQLFVGGAVLGAIPGIVVQIVLIPLLVMALQKAGLTK